MKTAKQMAGGMSKRIKNFTSCKLVLAMKDVPTYDIAKQTTYIPK